MSNVEKLDLNKGPSSKAIGKMLRTSPIKLNDAASDYSIARRVLSDYHPLEAEMTLQLAMQFFPQVFAGEIRKGSALPADPRPCSSAPKNS